MKQNKSLTILVSASCLIALGMKLTYNRTSRENKQLQQQARSAHVDFDISMQTNAYANLFQSQRAYRQELDFFKSLYNRYNLKQITVQPRVQNSKNNPSHLVGKPVTGKKIRSSMKVGVPTMLIGHSYFGLITKRTTTREILLFIHLKNLNRYYTTRLTHHCAL